MLQLMCLDLDKIFKQSEREKKSGKKLKKNERGRMFTVALVYGGGRGIARSWLYCLCCTTTVYNARLLRCIWL